VSQGATTPARSDVAIRGAGAGTAGRWDVAIHEGGGRAAASRDVANGGATAQTQIDLVMSPNDRREYVKNFLKTEVRMPTLTPL
jgi:hypothetical protein